MTQRQYRLSDARADDTLSQFRREEISHDQVLMHREISLLRLGIDDAASKGNFSLVRALVDTLSKVVAIENKLACKNSEYLHRDTISQFAQSFCNLINTRCSHLPGWADIIDELVPDLQRLLGETKNRKLIE